MQNEMTFKARNLIKQLARVPEGYTVIDIDKCPEVELIMVKFRELH